MWTDSAAYSLSVVIRFVIFKQQNITAFMWVWLNVKHINST